MERVKVKVDESHVPKTSREEKNVKFEEPVSLESDRMTSILLRTMYVQWVIITFLIGIIFVRLVYSTDENWTFFVSSTLILCFAVIPIIITISCVDCCSKKKSNKEEKKKVSNDETDDKSSTTKQITPRKPRKSRSTTRKSKPKPATEEDTAKSTMVSKDTTVPEKKQSRSVSKKRKTSKPKSISKNRVKSKSRSVSKRRKPSKSRSTSRKPNKSRSVSKNRTASKPRTASKKRETVDSPSITEDIISLSQSLFGEPRKTRSKSRPRSTSKPRSSSRKRRSTSKPRSSSRKRRSTSKPRSSSRKNRSSSKPRSSSRKRNSSKPRNVSKTRKPRSVSKKREPNKNQSLNTEPKVSFTKDIIGLSQSLFGKPKKKPVNMEPKAKTEDLSESEEKKINLEIKVECVDENNSAGVSNLNIHAQVENDHLDMETQLGSEGADVYSEAKVEDEGENSSIKITIDTEQPDTGLEVENTLIGDEKRITATLDNDGVEQTKKIKIDLETDSDSDHQEAEGHIHIDSK